MDNRFFNLPLCFLLATLLWLLPSSAQAQWEELSLPTGGNIWGMATDGEVVLAMLSDGIFSWQPGTDWKKCQTHYFDDYSHLKYSKGVFYSSNAGSTAIYSTDQGANWALIKNFRFDKGLVLGNGQKFFTRSTTKDSIFLTTDFGENWNYLPAANPNLHKILNAAVLGDTMLVVLNDQLTRSFDGGTTWELIPPPQSFPSGSGLFAGMIAIKGVWYIQYSQNGSLLYRSTDDGTTWTSLGSTPIYEAICRIGNRLYRDGAFYSDDQGLTWTQFRAPGFYQDLLNYKGKLFLSGTLGMYEDVGGHTWHSLNRHFPKKLVSNENDESMIVTAAGNLLLSSGYYSPDEGQNWYLPQSAFGISEQTALHADTLVAKSPYDGIYYTPNGGQSWLPLPVGNLLPYLLVYVGDTLYTLNTDYKIWQTTDLGQHWYPFDGPPGAGVNRIGFDGNAFYVADYGHKKVYRTYDHGQNWLDISDDVPALTSLYVNTTGAFIEAGDHLYRYEESLKKWVVSDSGFFGKFIWHIRAGNNLAAAVIPNLNQGLPLSPDGGRHWFNALTAGLYPFIHATAANFVQGWLYVAGYNIEDGARHLLRRPMSGIPDLPLTGQVFGQIQPGVPNAIVRLRSGNGATTPQPNGFFELHGLVGPDTLDIAPIPGYSNVTPDYWLVSEGGPGYTFYLGQADPLCNIAVTNFTPFKADVETTIDLELGCLPDTGLTVNPKVVLSPNLHYVSAQPSPSSVNAGTLQWNNLQQANNGLPEIKLTVRTDAQAMINDAVDVIGSFKRGSKTYSDTLHAFVVSAFDPNDKQCHPERISPQQGLAGAEIDYVVRFQNTGTHPAENIRVRDTLDQHLDISTVQMAAASHPASMSLLPGRVIEFLFSNIMLADSGANEAASHGFVRFTTRSMPGLQIGDSIPNRAAIYFDANAPVITNTCRTVVNTVSGTDEPSVLSPTLRINPNPASGHARLSVAGISLLNATISASDAPAKVTKHWQCLNDDAFDIPVKTLGPGIWFITVRQGNWTATTTLYLFD